MRTIDRDGFGPAVRDDSENLKLYLARRVQQRTAKFRCRCYRRAGTWSSFDRGEKMRRPRRLRQPQQLTSTRRKGARPAARLTSTRTEHASPAVRLAMMKSEKSVSRSSISNGYVMAI